MLAAVIKKTNHEPISFLRRRFAEQNAADSAIHTVRRVFNLDVENVPEDAHLGRRKPTCNNSSCGSCRSCRGNKG